MIMGKRQRRALRFVEICNQGGHHPKAEDVERWLSDPKPRPATPGRRIPRATPSRSIAHGFVPSATLSSVAQLSLSIAGRDDLFSSVLGMRKASWASLGSAISQYSYEPGDPAETVCASLQRLGWLEEHPSTFGSGDGLRITPLGSALLRGEALSGEHRVEVILGKDDPVAYARLIGEIAGLEGDIFVVDPYLRVDQLNDLVTHTGITRALIRHNPPTKDAAPLRLRLATEPDLEIRQAPAAAIHDRYVLSEQDVFMLGASINTTQSRNASTVFMRLSPGMAAWVRNEHEQFWRQGTAL